MSQASAISNTTADRVTNIEYLKDASSKEVTVTTSTQTLAELLSSALPTNVMAVTLLPGGNTIRYNPAGEASAANAALPTSIYTIWGNKSVLDVAEFYAGSSLTMGVIVHVPAFTDDQA